MNDAFVVSPNDPWVMGRIKGRDMLALQTRTPVPGFQKRLIVRAERAWTAERPPFETSTSWSAGASRLQ